MERYILNPHILNDDKLTDIFILSPVILLVITLATVMALHLIFKKKESTQRIIGYSMISFVAPYSMLCYLNFYVGLLVSLILLLIILKAKSNETAKTEKDADEKMLKKEKLSCLVSFFGGIFIWMLVFFILR